MEKTALLAEIAGRRVYYGARNLCHLFPNEVIVEILILILILNAVFGLWKPEKYEDVHRYDVLQ